MIISHKYRYLFIETPHTGSTAIHNELVEHYGGESILTKHASYNQFLRVASPEEKQYRVFAGVRHPMDECVTQFFKMKTDHSGKYSARKTAKQRLMKYDWVQKTDADFPDYFLRFHRIPYDNPYALLQPKLTAIVKFEHISEDFTKALKLLGCSPVRELPRRNATAGRKQTFDSYYTPEIRERAIEVFGPYMTELGFDFPSSWGDVQVPTGSTVLYNALRKVRRVYWGYRTYTSTTRTTAVESRQPGLG